MACRFAGGVDSPATFWNLLREGRDTIGELPGDRWDWYTAQGREHAEAVRGVTKRGAFLDDVKGFDADFFGVTPREAELMDPQQRIALELAWEALEHAGIPAGDLARTDTGVFMGVGADDYGRRLLEDLPRIEAWTGIGGAYCAVANRVSHLLDLRGPSIAVDTACSSSLAAIHLAVQALRAGECPVALAGGVLVIAAPGLSLVLDAAGATSPDGRSKSFDAAADGYGRGEGGGVIVLKRLDDARRDGDRVLAVIRGSAVHQDGRTNGIMAPNGEAQAHMLRRTYQSAGIDPSTVGYVEAHGTGTRVGDPLEAGAMSSVFGPDRPADRPCLIGSVKPNVGHLEAGAGVAGVIKTVLALWHAQIPPSLNFTTPNPAIDWASCGLQVVTAPTPWPDHGGPRRAGVSAYGYGGTIAHVILEQGDSTAADPGGETAHERPRVYPLSGASAAAIAEYAGRLAETLGRSGVGAVTTCDTGYTLARRREHLSRRAAVVAADRAQLIARLRELAEAGDDPDGAAAPTGAVLPAAGRGLVWVFSGHGSQWIGMGRELLATEPAFAAVIDELEPVFLAELGVAPRAVIGSDEPQPVDVVQPMIFAMQVALGAVWRACGVTPDAVIGHSVGEIAAAVTAGVLTVEQGARLVCRRSVLLRRVAGQGAMAMVGLPPEQVEQRLLDRLDVSLAVASSTGSAVISGNPAAVAELSQRWLAEGVDVRRVDSDVAFHSPQMDPLVDPLAAAAADLTPAVPERPLYTTALADPRSAAARDGAYWAANLRRQVRFAQAVTAAVEDGYRMFVEVSPHPVVEHSIVETLEAGGIDDAFAAHTLRRSRPEREILLTNLGLLYCRGAEIDWRALWPAGELAELPTTAWQHRPHWAEEPADRSFLTETHDPASHTLLGGRINVHGTTLARAWLTSLDREARPYPGDHPVREVEIIPAAVLLNSFLTAASSTGPWPDMATGPWPDLTDVALRVPVSVNSPRFVQIVLQDGTVRLSSRIADDAADDKGWVTHTTAAVEPHTEPQAVRRTPADEELPTAFVVDRLATLGVAAMGFPWVVERLHRGEGVLVATVSADPESDVAPPTWAAVLDAALSTASVVFTGPPILRMPAHVQRVSLTRTAPARARITVRETAEHTVDVEIADLAGNVAGRLSRLRYGVLDSDLGAVTNPRRLVHTIAWRPLDRAAGTVAGGAGGGAAGTAAGTVVLLGPDSPLRAGIAAELATAAVPHRLVADPDDLGDAELSGEHAVVVVPGAGAPTDPAETAARVSWLLARAAKRLAATGLATPARMWCVTQGVRDSVEAGSLGHGSLWGIGRIVGGEHPEFWGGVVDIGDSRADLAALVELVARPDGAGGEDVVVIRDGEPAVARLRQLDGEPVRSPVLCQPDGTYLITGGLGALGLEVAHWLADRGMRRVVLAGRRALPPRDGWDDVTDSRVQAQIEAVRSLERLGVTVVTVGVDIADSDAAAKLLSATTLGLPPIMGVVHAAGVLDNRTLRTLDEESLRTVLRPKVNGALVLHGLFPPGSLDFFVLFSSCGQLLGLPGQASYAAGNAFLDALAAHRRAAGDTATTSFGWTSWRGLGMSTSSAVIDAELAARGTADVSVTEAFGAWELAERYDPGYAAVLRTIPLEPGEVRPPLLSELPVDEPAGPAEPAADAAPWLELSGAELHAALIEEISRQVAGETRLSVGEVDAHRALSEMGLDSVMTVRIRRGLERRFRQPLPATVFWDRPTIDAIAALLAERVEESRLRPAA